MAAYISSQAAAHFNLGSALLSQGKLEEAVTHCQQALRVQPDFAEAHNNLASARFGQGRLEEAVRHWQLALCVRPDFAEAHNNLATALHGQGKLEEAVRHWQLALQFHPDYPDAHYNLANALLEQEKWDEGLAHYREALRLRPDFAEAHFNLSNALQRQRRVEEAVTHLQQALRLQPASPEAHHSLANALLTQGRLPEAVRHCQQALRLKASFPDAWNTLGNIRQQQGQFDEALACYDHALRLCADLEDARFNRSRLFLLQGNWAPGWPDYECRWESKAFPRHLYQQLRWDGSDLQGRTILVYAEQGLGDTLHFIRYLPLVKQRGGRVIFQCQAALLPLLACVPQIDHLMAEGSPLPVFDVQTALLSLPGIAGTSLATVPRAVPYLHADADLVEHWRQEVRKNPKSEVRSPKSKVQSPKSEELQLTADFGLRTSDFLVGIAWQGNPAFLGDRQRSIPLAQFAPLAQVPGVRLISLQKGEGTEQLEQLRIADCGLWIERQETKPLLESAIRNPQSAILDLGSRLDEANGAFMDTAAVMMNMDLVITSDTAVAHLAGALGVPVWVALPLVPDWRWLLERDDSPWYPTMRLFRQTRYSQWEDVFGRMVEEMKGLVPQT